MQYLIKWCRQLRDANSFEYKRCSALKGTELLPKQSAYIEQLTLLADREVVEQANALVDEEDPSLTPLLSVSAGKHDDKERRKKKGRGAKSLSPPSRQAI